MGLVNENGVDRVFLVEENLAGAVVEVAPPRKEAGIVADDYMCVRGCAYVSMGVYLYE